MMKTALFTVSFAGLWGQHQLTLEETIEEAARLGYDAVMPMGKRPHLSPLDYSVDACKRLRERIDQLGIGCCGVAGYTNFTSDAGAAEVPFGEMQIEYVAQLAERAAALGGEMVRVFTSYEHPGASFFTQWDKTVKAIRECADRTGEFGVSISVQNHHDIAVVTEVLDEFIDQVDRQNVVANWDCWSPNLRGEDLAAGAGRMAKRMKMTIAADYVVLPRARYEPSLVNYKNMEPAAVLAVPMGEGQLDYKTFFDSLKREGFDGWVVYENCSPLRHGGSLETLRRYSRAFLKYMKPWHA
jgi:sugar phosphate isomerase/epimerase